MTGVQTEYLLGLYFLVVSITWTDGRISADAVKLVAAIIFLLLAFFSKSLIG